jgi:hypothetical protein
MQLDSVEQLFKHVLTVRAACTCLYASDHGRSAGCILADSTY